jgi:hypothetical protein
MGLDYYTSERFIHDELARRAEKGLSGLYETWKTNRKIEPFIITWPADDKKARSGGKISGPCVLELPADNKDIWHDLMLGAIQTTSAYAILVAEQRESDVRVIFESRHGALCWTIPIVRSGDVDVLKRPVVSTDGEHIGLLWKKDEGKPS